MFAKAGHFYASALAVLIIIAGGYSDNPGKPGEPDTPDFQEDAVGSIPNVVDSVITIAMPGTKISQLVGDYDKSRDEPTLNRTNQRYQLEKTDLGVPFIHDDRTYILFGDTFGIKRKDRDAIAYTTDTNPKDGLLLEFVHDQNGAYKPIDIPEISQLAFEVPAEGVGIGDSMYIYHTTDHTSQVVMGRTVLAKSLDNGETFNYLYDLSTSKFINLSIVKTSADKWDLIPENEGEILVMFGSGRYRKSDVYLAWQPASGIEKPFTIRYFAGVDNSSKPLWSSNEADALLLFDQPCIGELSVSYNTFIDRWIMLYNCASGPRGLNIINMRTAEFPWGPWTRPQVLFHPWNDGGYCQYIHKSWQIEKCDSIHDIGRENDWGDVYGPFQFEHFAAGDSSSTTIYFTMSTWNPYTVVLMKAGLKKE